MSMQNFRKVCGLIVIVAFALPCCVIAEETVVELRFENRRFSPQTITVPANQSFRIKLLNASKETIEFESFKLNREKVVGPGETATIFIPALKPGRYDFYDDFHQDVPQGTIDVK
jgi:cupredoxin-like protein